MNVNIIDGIESMSALPVGLYGKDDLVGAEEVCIVACDRIPEHEDDVLEADYLVLTGTVTSVSSDEVVVRITKVDRLVSYDGDSFYMNPQTLVYDYHKEEEYEGGRILPVYESGIKVSGIYVSVKPEEIAAVNTVRVAEHVCPDVVASNYVDKLCEK